MSLMASKAPHLHNWLQFAMLIYCLYNVIFIMPFIFGFIRETGYVHPKNVGFTSEIFAYIQSDRKCSQACENCHAWSNFYWLPIDTVSNWACKILAIDAVLNSHCRDIVAWQTEVKYEDPLWRIIRILVYPKNQEIFCFGKRAWIWNSQCTCLLSLGSPFW